jgi:hypothetical protein
MSIAQHPLSEAVAARHAAGASTTSMMIFEERRYLRSGLRTRTRYGMNAQGTKVAP